MVKHLAPSMKHIAHSLIRQGLTYLTPDVSSLIYPSETLRLVYGHVLFRSAMGDDSFAVLTIPVGYKPEYWYKSEPENNHIPFSTFTGNKFPQIEVVDLRGNLDTNPFYASGHFVDLLDRVISMCTKTEVFYIGGNEFYFKHLTLLAPTGAKANLLSVALCDLWELNRVPCELGKPRLMLDQHSDFVMKKIPQAKKTEEMVFDGIIFEVLQTTEPRVLVTPNGSVDAWKDLCLNGSTSNK